MVLKVDRQSAQGGAGGTARPHSTPQCVATTQRKGALLFESALRLSRSHAHSCCILRYVEDHTVHLVPEGGMALPPNVHAAEASGGRVDRDVLPLQLPQRAKPAHPAPRALRARAELQHGARRRKRVDHAQDGEAE